MCIIELRRKAKFLCPLFFSSSTATLSVLYSNSYSCHPLPSYFSMCTHTHHESSGGIITDDIISKDPEALPLLIRGVGTRLDVSTRETRLQGMRIGEAAAALGGQNLRFAELDDERGGNDYETTEATEATVNGQEGKGVFLSKAGGQVGRKGEDEKKGETKEEKEMFSAGYGGGDYDDIGSNMEAYDLWDEEEDLAAVAEPVYLDQLIEREH